MKVELQLRMARLFIHHFNSTFIHSTFVLSVSPL